MIGIVAKVSTKKVTAQLRKIQKVDVPTAMVAAGRKSAKMSITQARRSLSSDIKVPQKYLSSRFTAKFGNTKNPRAAVTFRHLHINPAGTRKYPVAVSTAYRITKTGKKGKGHGAIKGIGGSYDNAWLYTGKNRNYRIPWIMQRTGSSAYPIKVARIEIGQHGISLVGSAVNRVGPPIYKKEFERVIKMRIARRGTR